MSNDLKMRIVIDMDGATRKGTIQHFFNGALEEEHSIKGFEIQESRTVSPVKNEEGKFVSIKKTGPTIVSLSMVYDEDGDDTETPD